MPRLKFGSFLAPLHPAGQNPTLNLQRDLRFVETLDEYGYDEVWIGEHHSAGAETVGFPEIFIAAASERTRNIRFGTGVTSISYHNPLWVAERMVLLDHLTRGRIMLGVGPGSLPTDAAMLGMTPTETRELLEVDLDIILRLLAGETVTEKTRTHDLVEARLQLRPYTEPRFPVAVASVASPGGARLAGRHGLGLLSIGATMTKEGFDALAYHWDVVTERASHYGQPTPDRGDWRLVGAMHIAETREQAYADVEFGIREWFTYFQKVAAFPQNAVEGDTVAEMIDFMNSSGAGVIGTPEDARRQIERLQEQSGGFGAMLLQAHDWAPPAATARSLELIAQDVMPHFQGGAVTHAESTLIAERLSSARRTSDFAAHEQAIVDASDKYARELQAE